MRYLTVIAVFVLIFSVVLPSWAQDEESEPPREREYLENKYAGDLRGFFWGLSPTVILENEPAYFLGEENGALFYQDYYDDIKVTIGYEFVNNKLWRAKTFNEKYYFDPQERIEDMLYLEEALTRRLGEPESQDFRWVKDTEKNWPDKWGYAVWRSELFITIKWVTDSSIVTLYLGAEEYLEPDMTITYVSRKISEETNKKIESELIRAPQ